jgi:hypothetical protein
MGEQIVFTVRLTPDDWEGGLSAWRCPAVDIPSAFIKEARDPDGQPIALSLLSIDEGPARVSWKGPGVHPPKITIVVELGEKLSLVSAENFWRRLAIVVPIITAIIGLLGGWITNRPGPNPPPLIHSLLFRVDPNDLKDSGMPPAKITINNQEINQAVPYKVESDVTAVVDTTAAYRAFVNNTSIVTDSVKKIDSLFPTLNALNAQVTGRICSGGSNGVPSDVSAQMGKQTTDISDTLRGVRLELGRVTK